MRSLEQMERLAGSKWAKLLHSPAKYLYAMFLVKVLYPRTKKGELKDARTFFGAPMQLLLPAATDIYLTGGKSHSSEVRLAKYMLLSLNEGHTFIDIGAHVGYYTLLAADLVGSTGKVMSIEASKATFALLEQNVSSHANIEAQHMAMSDKEEEVTFYEFPLLYSEYNSMDAERYKHESWIQQNQPEVNKVQATTLDKLTIGRGVKPYMVKIDVEGCEDMVIAGAAELLSQQEPIMILEFVSGSGDEPYYRALKVLKDHGYSAHAINEDGTLRSVAEVRDYMQHVDSDNIVFKKVK